MKHLRARRVLSAAEIEALWASPVMPTRKAEQAAQISHNAIYKYMADGTLPFVQLGKRRLINTAALKRLITEGLPQSE
jgi:excisionase family DNA binding protein